ncbi:hypothetical protein GCM10028778_14150 [Barrientosiimonas marina]|uniref:Glycine betaine ABC transporter substrate-binding protein n=1 Tax=Lentibacillus kimchii TaxID=1542911 RepID=A0ABW2UUE9_9BACI
MFKKFRLLGLAAALVLAITLAACGDDSNEESSSSDGSDESTEDSGDDASSDGTKLGGKDITLPYVAWAGSTTRTPILANVLEDVGYNVDVKQVEAGPMWTSTADNKNTFNATGWLPATHGDYLDQYSDKVKVYEEDSLVEQAPLALTVPSYMEDVNSVKDLKGNDELGEKVDWEIIGIDPGAGIMQNTEKALENYSLDNWELTSSSESAMLSELQTKIENEEPIVVPLWKPHWIFADLDLKMLEDPDDVYGGAGDKIQLVFNKGFEDAHPAAYKIATRFAADWGEEIENEYMAPIFVDDKDAEKVADQFMDENGDLVEKWEEGIAAE